MEKYWKSDTKPAQAGKATKATSVAFDNASVLSEFDRLWLSLIAKGKGEGWPEELHRYLKSMPENVSRDTDIVECWQVSFYSQDIMNLL
jgi:hypothetical protein